MKYTGIILSLLAGFLAGCSSTSSNHAGGSLAGAPRTDASPLAINYVDPPDADRPQGKGAAPALPPDAFVLPGAYRWEVVDGKAALVKETDAEMFRGGPTSLRVITGEVDRGELAYQPAMLPQELAAEVARSKAANDQLVTATAKQDELVEELLIEERKMQAENKALAQRLVQVTSEAARVQAAAPPASTPPPTTTPAPPAAPSLSP